MILVDESLPDSRALPTGTCPPCSGECDQGRTCPGPGRFGDGDADGLGVFRGLMSAIVLTWVGWALAWVILRLTGVL